MTDRQARLAARCFGLLICSYLLFIGFASFYLTDGISPSRVARAGFGELFFLGGEFRLRWYNLRDISTNLLLYIPLGCLVALFLAATGRLGKPGTWHLWWGVLLSVCVEIAQAFIGRFSDATDVISNGGGYLLGFLIARVGLQHYGMHPVALLGMTPGQSRDGINTLAGLRFVYLAVAFVTSLLPLDISVSVTRLFDKLAAEAGEMPGLIVDPFYHFGSAAFPVRYLTLKLLPFLPLAVLSAVIQLRRGRPSLLIPAFHCLLFAVVVEFSNLFVQSNRSDTIIPVLAFVAGLAVAAALLWFARRSTASLAMESGSERLYLYLSAGLLYVLFLLVVSLSPYEFELSARAIRTKLFQDSNVVPFLLHFSSRSISSAIDIVREFILYAPFGMLVALWLRGLAPPVSVRTAILSAALIGGAIAFWIEFLQLAVAGRYVDITDILLATCGSTAGAVMAPLFGRGLASGASRPGTEGEPG